MTSNEKLLTTKFDNFLRSISFPFVVFKIVFKNSNFIFFRNSNIVFLMLSNENFVN